MLVDLKCLELAPTTLRSLLTCCFYLNTISTCHLPMLLPQSGRLFLLLFSNTWWSFGAEWREHLFQELPLSCWLTWCLLCPQDIMYLTC